MKVIWQPGGHVSDGREALPQRLSALCDVEGHEVRLEVAMIDVDEPRLLSATVSAPDGDEPQLGLEDLPLGRLLAEAVSAARSFARVESVEDGVARLGPVPDQVAVEMGRHATGRRDAPRLWRVADVYAGARRAGISPVKAVEDAFRVSTPTAHRYITAARERRLLDAA